MLRENHRGRPCVPGVLDEARIPTTLLYSRRDGGQAIIRDTDGSAVVMANMHDTDLERIIHRRAVVNSFCSQTQDVF